jgi:Asp/Glu/hydantoin racemase
MKLLVVNPNISTRVTELIHAEALRSASPGTEITALTAQFGVAYIETRFEAMVGAYATAEQVAAHLTGHDAVIVAAFGDPGLAALREVLPVPVTGMTEASLATACQLGGKFSIVSISPRMRGWYLDMVHAYHLSSRLASFRALHDPLQDMATVQVDHSERLISLAQQCVREDGADVIVLAGAPLAGLARAIEHLLPVPVVDGVSSAVKQAELLVSLRSHKAREGSYAPPPQKPHLGLSPAMQALLASPPPILQPSQSL